MTQSNFYYILLSEVPDMVVSGKGKCASHYLGCPCEDCSQKNQLARQSETLANERLFAEENGDLTEVERLSEQLKMIQQQLAQY